MDYRQTLMVEPGSKIRLSKINASYSGELESHQKALSVIQAHVERMAKLQYLLYADNDQSLLVVLQALDAAGKDGVIRHVFSGMNPQGTFVYGFKQPSNTEAAHDFLWRAHLRTPGKGEVAIFNRSYYEDVLVVRVHKLVPNSGWSKRYDLINDFEKVLLQNRTTILKFFLHISPEEQLARFKLRLDDPSRHWKISDSDYSERKRGRNMLRLMKRRWRERARSMHLGTLFRQTISGFGTSQRRKSLQTPWTRWALGCHRRTWTSQRSGESTMRQRASRRASHIGRSRRVQINSRNRLWRLIFHGVNS
jgi:PPK2 family polyphosphate:nucleotide phosphotransferase